MRHWRSSGRGLPPPDASTAADQFVATVPCIADLVLDLLRGYGFSSGIGVVEPTLDLPRQFAQCFRRLSAHDPTVGLTLELSLPQLTMVGHASYPVRYPRALSKPRCSADLKPGSWAGGAATNQGRVPRRRGGRRGGSIVLTRASQRYFGLSGVSMDCHHDMS